METRADVYALLTVVSRIEAGLRMLAHHPDQYAPNGHFDRVTNLVTVLQAEVNDWLNGPPGDQRHQARRQVPDRRVTPRRTSPDRRSEAPVTEDVA